MNKSPSSQAHSDGFEFDYIHDPSLIEKRSFQIIRETTNLSPFAEDEKQIVMRLIHTSGDTEVYRYVNFGGDAVRAGIDAIASGSVVLCDVEMLKSALTAKFVPVEKICLIGDSRVRKRAQSLNETRSMAAVHYWREHLAGSIVAIGNAPTALFRLLELIAQGLAPPKLIIAMPVGFVGAAESKEMLIRIATRLDIPFITLSGRLGGSAMTASVLNAIGRMHSGVRY